MVGKIGKYIYYIYIYKNFCDNDRTMTINKDNDKWLRG